VLVISPLCAAAPLPFIDLQTCLIGASERLMGWWLAAAVRNVRCGPKLLL
jgi:hypothetical protein